MSLKVLVGMSGGVDSSVAALLLKEQGYRVAGATLRLYTDESGNRPDAAGQARNICSALSIEHYTLDFTEQFKQQVINRFAAAYAAGITPNPCIDCNRYVKFKLLYHSAQKLGYTHIATGHYANITCEDGRWLLKKAVYQPKDQSYVLYTLAQEILGATLLPLGNLSKDQVRRLAAEHGLPNAQSAESQDICFVADGDYAAFLAKLTGNAGRLGDFIDTEGRVVGRHRGLPYYTIGQRKGINISFGSPRYVISINAAANTVTLGEEKDLYKNSLIAGDLNLIAIDKLTEPLPVMVKTRYRQPETPAILSPLAKGRVLVRFSQPQRALTPGQAAVFYDGATVIGGGTIC